MNNIKSNQERDEQKNETKKKGEVVIFLSLCHQGKPPYYVLLEGFISSKINVRCVKGSFLRTS
jgi:hypothetical protein